MGALCNSGTEATPEDESKYETGNVFLSRSDGVRKSKHLAQLYKQLADKIRSGNIEYPIKFNNLNIEDTWSSKFRDCDLLVSSLYLALAKSKSKSIQVAMKYSNTYKYDEKTIDETFETEISKEELENQNNFLKEIENVYFCRGAECESPATTSIREIYEVTHNPKGKDKDGDKYINFGGTYVCSSFMKQNHKAGAQTLLYINWNDLRNGGMNGKCEKYRVLMVYGTMHVLAEMETIQWLTKEIVARMCDEWIQNDYKKLRVINPLHTNQVEAYSKLRLNAEAAALAKIGKMRNENGNGNEERKDEVKQNEIETSVAIAGQDEEDEAIDEADTPYIEAHKPYNEERARAQASLWGKVYVFQNLNVKSGYYGYQHFLSFWQHLMNGLLGVSKEMAVASDDSGAIMVEYDGDNVDDGIPRIEKSDKYFACIYINETLVHQLNKQSRNNFIYLGALFETIFEHELYGHGKRRIDFGITGETPYHAESGFIVDVKDKGGTLGVLKTKKSYDGPMHRKYQYLGRTGRAKEIQALKQKEERKHKSRVYDIYKEEEVYNYLIECLQLAIDGKMDEIAAKSFPQPVTKERNKVTDEWIAAKQIKFAENEAKPYEMETSYSARNRKEDEFWAFCLD